MKKLLILGAGGYGRTVADLAQQLGCYASVRFLDDQSKGDQILGGCADYPCFSREEYEIYPAFGNNALRMNWMKTLAREGYTVPTLIHPRAYVSPMAELGTGTVVLSMAVVNTGVRTGDGCIINIGALIDHDCTLEEGVHLCPGVIVKAENRICAGEKIESGEVILARTRPLH